MATKNDVQKDQTIEIRWNQLVPSPTNPRKSYNRAGIEELAESIKSQGLINALLVRPIPFDKRMDYAGLRYSIKEAEEMKAKPDGNTGYYEVVAGNRRMHACDLIGKKKKTYMVRCTVRTMTDQEVLSAQMDENVQREDLQPWEEAEIYSTFLEKGVSVAELAVRFSKSQQYIHTRAVIAKLDPTAMHYLKEGYMQLQTAIMIARLQPEQQKQILENCTWGQEGQEGFHLDSHQQFKDNIRNSFELQLAKAPFSQTDNYGDILPCQDCPKNTGCNTTLFPDYQENATCTDSACYRKKKEAYSIQQKEAYLAKCAELEQEPVYVTGRSWVSSHEHGEAKKLFNIPGTNMISTSDYKKSKARKGVVWALVIATDYNEWQDLGDIIRIKVTPKEEKEEEDYNARWKKQQREAAKKEKIEKAQQMALYQSAPHDETFGQEEMRGLLNMMLWDSDVVKAIAAVFPASYAEFTNKEVKKEANARYEKIKGEKPNKETYLKHFIGHTITSLPALQKIIGAWELDKVGRYMVTQIPDAMLPKLLRVAILQKASYRFNPKDKDAKPLFAAYNVDMAKIAREKRKELNEAEKEKERKRKEREKKAAAKRKTPNSK